MDIWNIYILGIYSYIYIYIYIYGLDRFSARSRQTHHITYTLECKALNMISGVEGSDLTRTIVIH